MSSIAQITFRVLPHEDQSAFDALLASYHAELKPRRVDDVFLVEQMAQSRWKLARINRLEVEVVKQMCGVQNEPKSGNAILAAHILSRNGDAYATLQRWAAAAERTYHRCRRELIRNREMEARLATAQAEAVMTKFLSGPFGEEAAAETPELRNEPKSSFEAIPPGGPRIPDPGPRSQRGVAEP